MPSRWAARNWRDVPLHRARQRLRPRRPSPAPARRRGGPASASSASDCGGADHLVGAQRGQAAHQVLQLAHVAGPAIGAQRVHRAPGRATCTAARRRARGRGSGGRDRRCPRRARAAAAGGSAPRSAGRTDPRGTARRGSPARRSRWVAAMMRTLARIGWRPPTVVNSPSCSTRSSRVCASGGMSPISSRNSVPPSACSKRPWLAVGARR